jgi:condensin complex subunit 3
LDRNDNVLDFLKAIRNGAHYVPTYNISGPNYHFVSRQLLLLGGMLDFSDSINRKVAGSFLYELLIRPLEREVDEDGNHIAIGDNVRS